MNPRTRLILVGIGMSITAVWLAVDLAHGDYLLPMLGLLIALAAIAVHTMRLEFDVVFLGLVVFGYIAGSRGFAQFSLVPGLPLLPAEAALLVALVWRTIRCALVQELPFSRDPLQLFILVWLIVGSARFAFDLPRHGFLAARDFAVIYYALLFFLARHMARVPAARRYLIGCTLAGCLVQAVLYPLAELFPAFFFGQFAVRGVPLIYYKADLAMGYYAVGGILLYHWAAGRHRYWAWPLAVGMFFYALVSDVRSVMVGGVIVLALLAAGRRFALPLLLGGLATAGLAVLLVAGLLFHNFSAEKVLTDLGARVYSVVSVATPAAYAPKGYKIDNNRFRLVWWQSVVLEVAETNPAFGLGFGHDLAAGFLQKYDQDLGDEFVTRSPHSVAVTALGRLGLTGLLIWAGLSWLMVARSWQAVRHDPDLISVSLWCSVILLLVSATFGVVLEGPMGAVPFWVLLGLASAKDSENTESSKAALPLGDETASA